MKAAILAGGLGTRMQELTSIVPKPMIELGGKPILWHIMKSYRHFGINEFCIALGYKGDVIKEYFRNYKYHMRSVVVDLTTGETDFTGDSNSVEPEDWRINLVETGSASQTGARVARMKEYLGKETFCLTYGDGVSDVDIAQLIAFHKSHGKIATLTAVRPPSKFGALEIGHDNKVLTFAEKPHIGDSWINGGFFVFEPKIFDYLDSNETCILEEKPMLNLAKDGQLMAFHHEGYWHCMDTARDVTNANKIWEQNKAPWKQWR